LGCQSPLPPNNPATEKERRSIKSFLPSTQFSNLAEFFGAFWVEMAMRNSNYQKAAETAKTLEHWSKAACKRVLIVEDDRLSLKVLRQLLEARGYDVLQASGDWDAISRARHDQPELILVDLRLPDISGLDATRLLKMDDQTKNIPVIAVTAFVTPSFEATAF
jgi:CheY-like chemotaxis protein